MFKTIVWATDGSDNADEVLPFVRALAKSEDARLVLLHVSEMFATHIAAGLPVYADDNGMNAKIEQQAADLTAEGIRAEANVITFGPNGVASAIADIARQEHADLLVTGTRGHTALGGLMVGSVTQRLLPLAHCPVLVVPVGDRPDIAAPVAAVGAEA